MLLDHGDPFQQSVRRQRQPHRRPSRLTQGQVHIGALATLLEERHIGRAATRVHLSRSAMSRVLTRLRQALGDEFVPSTATDTIRGRLL
jgi:regulatory helix-turn-helix LysR family protein